jgi:antitoxin component of RelBE/YafQ-DinJ toxin-antitoxin module
MPNQPATPNRAIRVPDDLWWAAQRVAKDRGETVSDVVRRALERYVRTHPLNDDG